MRSLRCSSSFSFKNKWCFKRLSLPLSAFLSPSMSWISLRRLSISLSLSLMRPLSFLSSETRSCFKFFNSVARRVFSSFKRLTSASASRFYFLSVAFSFLSEWFSSVAIPVPLFLSVSRLGGLRAASSWLNDSISRVRASLSDRNSFTANSASKLAVLTNFIAFYADVTV